MKTTLNGIIVIFIGFITSFSFSQEYNIMDDQGRKQGKWIKTYEGKKEILYKGNFKDNKPTGLFVFYYESGKVKAKNTYFNDGYNSYASTYYDNGKLMSTGKYVNQKKDSTWVYLDELENYIYLKIATEGERSMEDVLFFTLLIPN